MASKRAEGLLAAVAFTVTFLPATSSALVEISVTPASIQFGNIDPGETNDTLDGSPFNFTIENTGNESVNVTINSTSLWSGESALSSDFQFQSSNKEVSSASVLVLAWTYLLPSAQTLCQLLNFNSTSDEVYTSIRVRVPEDEPPGAKSATITFIATAA